MNTAILLSYKGLGANLLHMAYCHEIAKKFGPVTIITLSNNLHQAIKNDPLIKEVICLEEYFKKITEIVKLSKVLKNLNFTNIFIFYPSIRFLIASKLAGIKHVYSYPLFKKKNLHLVKTAKKFIEEKLNINNCPTETILYVDKSEIEKQRSIISLKKKNIVLGVGSSGPTTRWGSKNFIELIKKMNTKNEYFFYLLCGPNESEIGNEIFNKIGKENCASLSDKNISEIVTLISVCNLYIGNDSFGHHVSSQRSIPSLIIMLDTPRAYSDYSKNQFRILPDGIKDDNISHNSSFKPESINVESVLKESLNLLKQV